MLTGELIFLHSLEFHSIFNELKMRRICICVLPSTPMHTNSESRVREYSASFCLGIY